MVLAIFWKELPRFERRSAVDIGMAFGKECRIACAAGGKTRQNRPSVMAAVNIWEDRVL
jgi:hypothetical protein